MSGGAQAGAEIGTVGRPALGRRLPVGYAPQLDAKLFDLCIILLMSAAENRIEALDTSDDLLTRIAPMARMPELRGRGVYLFCLREHHALPGIEVGAQGVVYVGMTEKSLLLRNHFLHAHSGGSTLRRSLGALLREELMLEPIRRDSKPENASNFRFTDDGETRLTEWMKTSLLAAQTEVSGNLRSREAALIQELEPPLNLTKWANPQKELVSAKRKACADIVLASFRE